MRWSEVECHKVSDGVGDEVSGGVAGGVSGGVSDEVQREEERRVQSRAGWRGVISGLELKSLTRTSCELVA